ncbi:MAG: DUF368 domain-containing protein [Acholeplasmatales bacterium]|nr:MAG: DUF368 domain-containing protein [Acholeplasmatales bacterium]
MGMLSKKDDPMKRLVEGLRTFVAGAFMGVAAIIPGVSSGTVAVIVKVYDRLILSVDTVIRRKVGMLAALLFLIVLYAGNFIMQFTMAGLIERWLEQYPATMRFFFMGLVIGSMPIIVAKTRENTTSPTFRVSTISAFTLAVLFIIVLNVVVRRDVVHAPITTLTFLNSPIIFLTGVIASATALVPGVSGSMMQLAIGVYPTYVAALSDVNVPILIVLFLGLVLGLILAARLLGLLLRRYYHVTYFAIGGLLVGSIVQIWPEALGTYAITDYGLFILVFALGFTLAFGSHLFEQHKKRHRA